MTTNFTDYDFKSDPAEATQTPRTVPVRLSAGMVNVKDWGAVGDGVTDDTLAIQNAINFGASRGASTKPAIFFPPGTYAIGNPGGTPTRLHLQGSFIGSGRDVTILQGDFSTGNANPAHFDGVDGWVVDSPRFLCYSEISTLDLLTDLTICNTSTVAGSGAYFNGGTAGGVSPLIRNCHFVGICGLHAWIGQFGIDIHNCKFTCIVDPARADTTVLSRFPVFEQTAGFTPSGPIAGTVGCYVALGSVINCRAEGFAVGYAFANSGGPLFAGNTAYRCDVPYFVGGLNKGGGSGEQTQIMNGGFMCSNVAERCFSGYNVNRVNEMGIVANVLASGTEGPHERAPITNMTWAAGGGGIVTVTTPSAHNLTGTPSLRLVVNPTSWVGASGVISPTVTAPTAFTYVLPTPPGSAFVSGEWNYAGPSQGLAGFQASCLFLAANISATPHDASINLPFHSSAISTCNNIAMAMRGPGGLLAPNTGEFPAAWELIMCGKGDSSPPVPRMRFSDLPTTFGTSATDPQGPFDGQTFNIVNGAGAGTFGSVVSSGGAGRWKVRYNSALAAWTRIG